jgi:Recombination endonuclease VII
MLAQKFCRDCGELRPVSEFTRDRARKDGLAFYCKTHARERLLRAKDARKGPPKSRHPRAVVVPAGSKWCPDCATIKPLGDFVRNSGSRMGWSAYCKPCHNVRGRLSKEKAGGSRTYHLKRRYGITAGEADEMLAEQGGLCAICRNAPAVHVDHDHATGAVRALLCFNCNGGLGQFKDDPAVLRTAVDYVRFHSLRQQVLAACETLGIGPVRAIWPGRPPVGSQPRPGPRGTTAHTTGRTSGSRRRTQAGEADG